ncbi:MAG: oligosaccharide flippase family protein [Actinomycetota bacterium]
MGGETTSRTTAPPRLRSLFGQSALYGLGGLVSRVLAVVLLPLYTHELTPSDYGAVETLVALGAVLVVVLRLGLPTAFFRFYFDAKDDRGRITLLRTSFWFTMASATLALAAGLLLARPIALELLGSSGRAGVVRAAFVAIWAQMNYEQLTSLFRVEQRAAAFVLASVCNIAITIAATVTLVVVLHRGATGMVLGNAAGTIVVYLALLAYRREQLGLQLDRRLLRELNRFGLPLVPAALGLWVVNFSDRFLLAELRGTREVGLYSIAVRLSSALLLLLTAFSLGWPAFAYAIEDDDHARHTYSNVLTALFFVCCWTSLALGLLAPWLVRLLTQPAFYPSARAVAPLAFSVTAYAGYTVVAIGIGRARRTGSNWLVTGAGAVVNAALNVALIPRYGMLGAAVATLVAYAAMFAGMASLSQRVFPVPYRWERIAALAVGAALLTAVGRGLHASALGAAALIVAYPLLAGASLGVSGARPRLRRLASQLAAMR